MFQLSNDFEDNLGDLFDIAADKVISNIENEICTKKSVDNPKNTEAVSKSDVNGSQALFDDLDDDDDLILSVADVVDTPPVLPIEQSIPIRDQKTHESKSQCSQLVESVPQAKFNFKLANNQISHRSTESEPNSNTINNKHRLEMIDDSMLMKTAKIEYERKFPGPAGLIKKKTTEDLLMNTQQHRLLALNQSLDSNDNGHINLLENISWQKLLIDLDTQPELSKIAQEYTIAKVRRMNIIRNTSRKIPLFAAVIFNVDPSVSDPSIILKDSSGEIRGSVHKDFWEEYNNLLSVGSAVLLKQASVLSILNSRKLFLNITSNNVATIYTPQPDNESVLVTRLFSVSPVDCIDLSKTETCSKRKSLPSSSSSPLPSSSSSPLLPTRSHADLLKIVQNSCNSKELTSVKSIANETESSPTIAQHSTTTVSSKFQFKTSHSSTSTIQKFEQPKYDQIEEFNSSVVDNVLEGIDANSFFDDF